MHDARFTTVYVLLLQPVLLVLIIASTTRVHTLSSSMHNIHMNTTLVE